MPREKGSLQLCAKLAPEPAVEPAAVLAPVLAAGWIPRQCLFNDHYMNQILSRVSYPVFEVARNCMASSIHSFPGSAWIATSRKTRKSGRLLAPLENAWQSLDASSACAFLRSADVQVSLHSVLVLRSSFFRIWLLLLGCFLFLPQSTASRSQKSRFRKWIYGRSSLMRISRPCPIERCTLRAVS